MPEWLTGMLVTLGATAGTGLLVSLFAKFCPKENTYDKRIKPIVILWAKTVSLALGRWIGAGNAAKIEEGIFHTLAFWMTSAVNDFYAALTADNKK